MQINDILTPEELARVTDKSDLWGAWMVFTQFVTLAAIFIVMATWTNPITIVFGTIMLGGRFLGFGVLSHECGHKTLFRTRWLNQFVGEWLTTPPAFSNNRAYMRGHLQHHRLAGTDQDPDLPNYRDYPITKDRLRRKLKRDLTGQTGWRTLKGIAGRIANLHKLNPESRDCMLRGLAFNAGLLAILVAFGEGWLFLTWTAAYIFINPLLSRIRQVSEHGAVPDLYDDDPRNNTRTVYLSPLTRLVLIPFMVNYHLEHHMLASVPAYRLRTMHEILKAKGFYDGVDFPRGYLDLMRKVTREEEAPAPA